MYKVKKGIDTMYYLKNEACVPYELNEEEYNWMVGQLKARRAAYLKQAMTAYMDCFGIAEFKALVKKVTKE